MAMTAYYTTKGQLQEIINGNINHKYGVKVFVDVNNGSDNNDGSNWMKAKATIQAGVNLARYVTGTTTINSDKDHLAYVFVAPGHYNEDSLAWSGYGINIIGMGGGVPGKDYGVSINYDGANATYAGMAFGGSNNSLQNLHIYVAEAIPGIWCNAGDNNLIKNCVIECDGTNATYGIHMDSMKGSRIEDCVIINPITSGIYVKGGAGVYAINGYIKGCNIIAANTGVKGIHIENTVTAYNFSIKDNDIDVESGGATSVGIHNESTGNVNITKNNIIKNASASAVTTAGSSAEEGDIEGKIDTIDTNVDAVLVDTGTTLPTTLGTPADTDIATDIANAQTDITSINGKANILLGNSNVLKVTIADGTTLTNNTQVAAGLLATASGNVLIEDIIVQRGATNFVGPTNLEFTTDNAAGLTGVDGPQVVMLLAKFNAATTSIGTVDGATKQLPFVLEDTKKLYIHGDDAAVSAGGTTDFYIIYKGIGTSAASIS